MNLDGKNFGRRFPGYKSSMKFGLVVTPDPRLGFGFGDFCTDSIPW